MKMNMSHIGLSVANIEKAATFYCDHFGMERTTPIFPFEGRMFTDVMGLPGATGRMCMLTNGNVRIELFQFDTPQPKPKPQDYPVADHGYSHFGIDVEDIEAVVEQLTAAGCDFHCPVMTYPSGMRATYGRDPDGNVFELLEMGPKP